MAGFFGAGAEAVFRDRRKVITDPYNPARQVAGDWEDPDTITLEGCYVATSSTSLIPNNARQEGIIYKSLFIPNAGADVQLGDRIRTLSLDGAEEHVYGISGIPSADRNPWTGWRPILEVPLEGVVG